MGTEQPAGVILAGGLSRRMGGGDKALATLGNASLLGHVIDRLEPQVDRLALNANGDPTRFASFGLTVLPDSVEGFAGPLAGVLAGLDWAARQLKQLSSKGGGSGFLRGAPMRWKKLRRQGMLWFCRAM